jgi:uncharacterized DUF497 family protein
LIEDWDLTSFDWDDGNLRKNERKHGISQAAIEALFRSVPVYFDDPGHSAHEKRYIAVGRSHNGRWMLVSFTLRHRDGRLWLRPISARFMHTKEVRRYADQESPKKG